MQHFTFSSVTFSILSTYAVKSFDDWQAFCLSWIKEKLLNFVLSMKALKINLLSILLILPAFAFAQVPDGIYPNKSDAKGKQGAWKKLDEQGTVVYVGQFKDDKPYGMFIYFDTDGRKMTEMNFLNGGAIAYAKMYYANGFLQAEGKYLNQQKDSVWKFYTSVNDGELLSQETYVKGKKEGKATVYFPGTTKAASITIYKNGLEDGAYVEYYLEGQKKEEATYVAGNLEGKAVWYCPDGRINILGNYQHSVKHGIWTYYNCDGTLKGKETWELGHLKSQEQLVKPEDLNKNIEQEPGYDGQDPNGNGGGPN